MTYGEILFASGIGLSAVSVFLMILGGFIFRSKKRKLKEKLYDRYGL